MTAEPAAASVRMLRAIPALPVKDVARGVAFYREKLGFSPVHREAAFAILRRDAAEIHLWAANDEEWRGRKVDFPVVSGAESFLAGTASCRIGVERMEVFFAQFQAGGAVHPSAPRGQALGRPGIRGRRSGRESRHVLRAGPRREAARRRRVGSP